MNRWKYAEATTDKATSATISDGDRPADAASALMLIGGQILTLRALIG